MVQVNPQVYYDAASSCHTLADDLATQLGSLKAKLTRTDCMARDYPQVHSWSSTYASHSKDFMNGTAVLVNALENFSDILNVAGHNWAMANYNANRDPNKGAAPIAPARSPGPICRGETILPPSATGNNGDGLDTNIGGLLEKIGMAVPNGDTDKLSTAASSWAAFAGHNSITNAATTLQKSHDAFHDVVADDATAIQGHLATLKGGAAAVAGFASEMGSAVDGHHGGLVDLRNGIDEKTQHLLAELGVSTALTAIVVGIFTLATAGAAAAGPDEAIVGLDAAAVAGMVAEAATAIRGLITTSQLLVLLGGVAAGFAGAKGLTPTSALQHIAMLTAQTIDDGQPEKTQGSEHDTSHDGTAPERPPEVPDDWIPRTADNGKGVVWQKPGSEGNSDTIRIMDPTSRYPDGYVRYYNSHGQPVTLENKPGPNSQTHIPRNPDGSFPKPKGW
ncbi:hypothetical protein AAFP30_05690 [Gordonia sp. CPCC 205515]|uniref:hypothetical protein n=1 Tax=Gordonia sp. CPCC 205515 TaxID=3140791 RepID=UPI003AF3B4C1